MDSTIKLGIAALLPVFAAVILYILDRKVIREKVPDAVKQAVYGILFGGLAIIGTEWGIPMNGAQVNCRDAAVLIAGLMFGAPAGIIAGIIGAVERWIAVSWGVGAFTRVACTVSTFFAGFYAAGLRKFMFEDRKPGIFISFAIGVVMEIFHLTMVFLTNMSMPDSAMAVIKAATIPMVTANGVSVMLAAALLYFVSGDAARKNRNQRARISQTVQRWLLFTVVLAFLVTTTFVYRLQTEISKSHTDAMITLSLKETAADIRAENKVESRIEDITENRHIGETGYVLVFKTSGELVSAPDELSSLQITRSEAGVGIANYNTTYQMVINGSESYCRFTNIDDYYILAVYPVKEAMRTRDVALYVNTFMEILVFAVLFAMIYMLIKRVVVNQINDVNRSLSKISGGDLNEVVNVRTSEEFASLSDDINATVDTLKMYIDEASRRLDKELEFAKSIQCSALPNVFPAFPKRKDFDIFASMVPAKEVGGDFYDFYLSGENRLNFLVADVSGKGIPAAMFMMRAKTALKGFTEAELPLAEVFTEGNRSLCEGNDAGMFVTAWQGCINLADGTVRYVNAGHNPPLVKHSDGGFEYITGRAGFVLAGMDGVKYRMQELTLLPGDTLFLYTDGITEAVNGSLELFGEKRLLEAINSREYSDMKELCSFIKTCVDAFADGAPQADDQTMLAFRYAGRKEAPSIHFDEARIADIPVVTEFAETEFEALEVPMKTVTQFDIAIDEIYANIAMYAYPEKPGPVTVRIYPEDDGQVICLSFEDEGIPYDPLTHEDPDITLPAEERETGGLGILMVKKTMDEVQYRYKDKKNILTLKKFVK